METQSLIAGNGILVIESSADRARYILEYYEKCRRANRAALKIQSINQIRIDVDK